MIVTIFAQIFSYSTLVMFWGSIGPKNVGKGASCDGRINAEKYMETLQENLLQETKTVLGKKWSHSPHKSIFTKS